MYKPRLHYGATSVNVICYIIDKNGSFIRKKFGTRSNYYHDKGSILFSWDMTFNHPCREVEPGRMLEYINQSKSLTIAFAEVSHLDIEPAGRAEFQLHQSESNENEL